MERLPTTLVLVVAILAAGVVESLPMHDGTPPALALAHLLIRAVL